MTLREIWQHGWWQWLLGTWQVNVQSFHYHSHSDWIDITAMLLVPVHYATYPLWLGTSFCRLFKQMQDDFPLYSITNPIFTDTTL